MKCPACWHEFKSPVAQAGGLAGGAAKVQKGFAVAGRATRRYARKRTATARKMVDRRYQTR